MRHIVATPAWVGIVVLDRNLRKDAPGSNLTLSVSRSVGLVTPSFENEKGHGCE
jgi:hypothetical protein